MVVTTGNVLVSLGVPMSAPACVCTGSWKEGSVAAVRLGPPEVRLVWDIRAPFDPPSLAVVVDSWKGGPSKSSACLSVRAALQASGRGTHCTAVVLLVSGPDYARKVLGLLSPLADDGALVHWRQGPAMNGMGLVPVGRLRRAYRSLEQKEAWDRSRRELVALWADAMGDLRAAKNWSDFNPDVLRSATARASRGRCPLPLEAPKAGLRLCQKAFPALDAPEGHQGPVDVASAMRIMRASVRASGRTVPPGLLGHDRDAFAREAAALIEAGGADAMFAAHDAGVAVEDIVGPWL